MRKSMILIMIMLLAGCSNTSYEKVSEYDIEHMSIEVKSISESSLLEYEAFEYKDNTYLSLSDFEELSLYINDKVGFYDVLDFTKKGITLSYKSDSLYSYEDNGMIYYMTHPSEPRTLSNYVSSDDLYSWIEIDNEVFLPLDILRYRVFFNNSYLHRVDQNSYVMVLQNDIWNYYSQKMDKNNTQSYVTNYQHDIAKVNQFLEMNLEYEYIQTYEDFFIEVLTNFDDIEDYHFQISPLSTLDFSGEEREEVFLILEESFMNDYNNMVPQRESNQEIIVWEFLSDRTVYIDVNDFGVTNDEYDIFRTTVNIIAAKLGSHPNVNNIVIDLRDNLGGSPYSLFVLLDKLTSGEFAINYGYTCSEVEMCSDIVTFTSDQEYDYKYTVIVNEVSSSNSVFLTSIMKDYFDAKVIGAEPLFKKTEPVHPIQLPDGTIITLSNINYSNLTKDGKLINSAFLIEENMSNEQVEEFLFNLR